MSTRRGPGRPRDPAVDQAIERAAWQVLADQGPRRLSPERVAEEAGVAVSTVYRRFRTGDDLLLSLMNHVYAAFPDPDTGNLRDDLDEFMAGVVRALTPIAPRRALIVALVSAMEDNPEVAEAYELVMRRRREATAAIFSRAVERGELPAGADTTVVAEMLASFSMYRLVMVRGDLDCTDTRTVLDVVLQGLLPR